MSLTFPQPGRVNEWNRDFSPISLLCSLLAVSQVPLDSYELLLILLSKCSKPNCSALCLGAICLQLRREAFKDNFRFAVVFTSARVEIISSDRVIHSDIEDIGDVLRIGGEGFLRVLRSKPRPFATLVFVVERPDEVRSCNHLIDEIVSRMS